MATNVFDLVATLSLDSDKYENGLNTASTSASKWGTKLASAAKVGAVAVAATATAVVGGTKAIIDGTSKVAEHGDNIDKMSQKMGISAQAYQEWDAIMQHSGTSIDALKPSMKTLANQAQQGAEEFQKLGISQEEVANLSQEDLFARTIEGLQNMEEGTERTAITAKLLGRGATELGALLNTSAEDTEKMRQRVHELGGVMSDEAVKASAKYQDTLQDMTTAFDGLKRTMMSGFMPAVTTVMEGLTGIFTGDTEGGLATLSKGITDFVDNLTNNLPTFLEVGAGIVQALMQGIIDNLPAIFDSAIDVILELAKGLISALPQLAEGAVQIIVSLAKGISEMAPDLIPVIVDVVLTIVETLLDNLDLLIDASVELIIALTVGIINALPILIERAPEIIAKLVTGLISAKMQLFEASLVLLATLGQGLIDNIPELIKQAIKLPGYIVDAIKEKFPDIKQLGKDIIDSIKDGLGDFVNDALEWGSDLIDNFVDGIKGGVDKVGSAVKGVGNKVKGIIGFSEPEEGPLSNFHTYAPDMIDLFVKGIKDNEDKVKSAISSLADTVGSDMSDINVSTRSVSTSQVSQQNTGLISYLEQLVQSISNLKIFLDSGALVGGVVGDIDTALGTRQSMAMRGVIM